MAEKYLGKWKLTNSENFDEYMKTLGVNFALRKMGNLAKPVMEFTITDGNWKCTSVSTIKTVVLEFKLNDEVEETTADGRKCKTVFTLEGEKLIQTQKATKPNEKDSVIERYIEGDELICICRSEDVECRRTFKRLQPGAQ